MCVCVCVTSCCSGATVELDTKKAGKAMVGHSFSAIESEIIPTLDFAAVIYPHDDNGGNVSMAVTTAA